MKALINKHFSMIVFSAFILALSAGTLVIAQDDTGEEAISGSNYLYIEEFELAPGAVTNEAIAEAQDWVKGYRATGEYKSVRLFIHNTGPRFALYMLLEQKSWQAIEDGQAKFFAANPELMDRSFNWGVHSDNLLGEIPVE